MPGMRLGTDDLTVPIFGHCDSYVYVCSDVSGEDVQTILSYAVGFDSNPTTFFANLFRELHLQPPAVALKRTITSIKRHLVGYRLLANTTVERCDANGMLV